MDLLLKRYNHTKSSDMDEGVTVPIPPPVQENKKKVWLVVYKL